MTAFPTSKGIKRSCVGNYNSG